jgi:hypothetical protein
MKGAFVMKKRQATFCCLVFLIGAGLVRAEGEPLRAAEVTTVSATIKLDEWLIQLPGRGPDPEPTSHTITQRFSYDHALEALARVRGFLDRFREVTDELTHFNTIKNEADKKLSDAEQKRLNLPDWETRYLAFGNFPASLEGALRLQQLRIKSLEHELALEKQKNGSADEAEVLKARRALDEEKIRFEQFWSNFGVAD